MAIRAARSFFRAAALGVIFFTLASPLVALQQSPPSGDPAASAPAPRLSLPPRPRPLPFAWSRPSAAELRRRRERLAEAVGKGVVLSLSRPAASDVGFHRYVPDPDFYYLTGIDSDPGALLMVVEKGAIASETLFLPVDSPFFARWNGERWTAGEKASAASGVKEIAKLPARTRGTSWKALGKALTRLVGGGARSFHLGGTTRRRTRKGAVGLHLSPAPREDGLRSYLEGLPGGEQIRFLPLSRATGTLRSIKSEQEIACIREAVRITCLALRAAMESAAPKMWEFEFQGVIEGTFLSLGASGTAFASICAAGKNACTLHYTACRSQAADGDLVLCDVGAAFAYYASDVTRTFPVNGRFTKRQREIYETVLRAQAAGEAELRPGGSLGKIHAAATRVIRAAGFRREAFPHFVGHHVGLNVHDPGSTRLQPGMVITIEPGIYLPAEGIGVRIEDTYLVTKKGFERLSSNAPRTVEEIEELVGRRR